MINTQLKNMLIGLFVMTGAFLIVGVILFIKPSVGDGKQVLKVRFSNIAGINPGTQVTFAGRPVGEVVRIQQISSSREVSVSEFGTVYPFLLTLHIDSSITVFSNDEIGYSTVGLLGEKYISITPRPQKPNKHYYIITEKDVVYADSTDLFESAVNEFGSLAEKFEETLEKVIHWMDKYGDELGNTVVSFHHAAENIKTILETVVSENLVQEITNSFASFGFVFNQLDCMISELRESNFTANLSSTMTNVESITESISSGKGTLGRLIEDQGLYLQVNQLMTKANILMNDINQYGLLFSYSKHWQRERSQLMAKAAAVSNPIAFQMQVDEDVDNMIVTLDRMQALTSRLSNDQLMMNREFKKQFVALMRRLDVLQENVKLYNMQLQEEAMKNKKGCNE